MTDCLRPVWLSGSWLSGRNERRIMMKKIVYVCGSDVKQRVRAVAYCPRCGAPMDGGVCDNCGFPAVG